jgi:hypothetical protein
MRVLVWSRRAQVESNKCGFGRVKVYSHVWFRRVQGERHLSGSGELT